MFRQLHQHNIAMMRWALSAPSECALAPIVIAWFICWMGPAQLIAWILPGDTWIESGIVCTWGFAYMHYTIQLLEGYYGTGPSSHITPPNRYTCA